MKDQIFKFKESSKERTVMIIFLFSFLTTFPKKTKKKNNKKRRITKEKMVRNTKENS
jgi:hypothetical protein